MSPRNWNEMKQKYGKTINKKLGPVSEVNDILAKLVGRRIALGLTQSEVARRVGIKQPALARMENFAIIPRMDTLIKLSSVLGLKFTIIEAKKTMLTQDDYNQYLSRGAYYGTMPLKIGLISQICERREIPDVKPIGDYWNEVNKLEWIKYDRGGMKYNVPNETKH